VDPEVDIAYNGLSGLDSVITGGSTSTLTRRQLQLASSGLVASSVETGVRSGHVAHRIPGQPEGEQAHLLDPAQGREL